MYKISFSTHKALNCPQNKQHSLESGNKMIMNEKYGVKQYFASTYVRISIWVTVHTQTNPQS